MENGGLVKGEDVVLLEWSGTDWVPFACARECSLTENTDFLEVSITGSGKWRDYLPTANSFTGTLGGVVNVFKVDHFTIADIRAKQSNHTKVLMRFQRMGRDTLNYYTSEAYFFFAGTTDSSSFDNIATFSVDLRGTGAITDIFTPTTIIGALTYSMYYHSDGSGETTFTDTDLIGKVVIGAWRQIDHEVITTGTVLVNEIKFNSGTGTFTWVIPMEPDEVWHIQYR